MFKIKFENEIGVFLDTNGVEVYASAEKDTPTIVLELPTLVEEFLESYKDDGCLEMIKVYNALKLSMLMIEKHPNFIDTEISNE